VTSSWSFIRQILERLEEKSKKSYTLFLIEVSKF